MNGAKNRQKVLLALLGAVVLFALWQLVAPGDGSDSGPAAGSPPAVSDAEDGEDGASARRPGARQRRDRDEERTDEVVDLRLAALDLVPRDYAPGRDPWRFREPPPPPPPVEPRVIQPSGPSPEELERQRQQLLEQQRLAAEAAASQPPPKPQPPIFPYTYMGYIGPANRRVAVFTDGQVTINRLEGEVLDDKFIVAQIGYESVEIRFIGFPDASQRLAVGRR
jgi:hypothetical protein